MAVVDCENARVLISPQANNMRLFVVALLANFYRTREREREREREGGGEYRKQSNSYRIFNEFQRIRIANTFLVYELSIDKLN